MNRIVILLALTSLAMPALGDVLGNPYDGIETTRSLAQDFGPYMPDTLDTWVVSDFQTAVGYYLYDVTSEGLTTHSQSVDGEGANFDIYDGLPWEGGSVVLSASDGYETLGSAGVMGADFGGQMLPAGEYYIVFQGVRDFLMTGGLSLVYHTYTGNEDDWEWNPGLGQEWGSDHRRVETTEPAYMDVNWQLTAVPVPEPAALTLLALGGLLLRRR